MTKFAGVYNYDNILQNDTLKQPPEKPLVKLEVSVRESGSFG